VVDGEEESRAARPDGWVVWEADERVAAEPLTFRFSFLLSLRGVIIPRTAEVEDFLLERRGPAGFLCFVLCM
jgi:hypothetical protein